MASTKVPSRPNAKDFRTDEEDHTTFNTGGEISADAQRLLELLNALLGSTFRQILWRKAADLELTFSQAQVLFYAEQHPGCIMGDVAKAYDVTLSAITQIINRLEQKGFITRRNAPADRRVYTLDLTPEGKTLVRELHTLQIEGLEHVLARMSPRDRRRVLKGLEAFVKAAKSPAGEGGEGKSGMPRRRSLVNPRVE
jgi:DNA-binding MarR family transcriptional regulator